MPRGGVVSRIIPMTHLGYRKITVERPLRLSFRATPERVARLEEQRAFQSLVKARPGAEIPAGVRVGTRAGKLLTVSGVWGDRKPGDPNQGRTVKVRLSVTAVLVKKTGACYSILHGRTAQTTPPPEDPRR